MMNIDELVGWMATNAEAIQALAQGLSDSEARWRPAAHDWSVLEVINHLCDEEIEDFRARLNVILRHPGEPWSAIDPEGWVTARAYNERDLVTSLENLARARRESLVWLRGLPAADWQTGYSTNWGVITAGDMLASWVAHDLLHMRQLVELRWALTTRLVAPYDVRYAGQW